MRQSESRLHLGFVGFGEAAFEMAKTLQSSTNVTILAYDVLGEDPDGLRRLQERAAAVGVSLVGSVEELAQRCTTIVVAVTPGAVVAVAEGVQGHLGPRHLYVDVCAATPGSMQQAAAIVCASGACFADVAMLGPLPNYGHRVPMLASGSGAGEWAQRFGALGGRVDVVGSQPGQASGIKLIRSIFMKGIAALVFETFAAARRFEVEATVMESIGETLASSSFADTVNRLICSTAIHYPRRLEEVKGVMGFLSEAGLPSLMTASTQRFMDELRHMDMRGHFGNAKPTLYREVLDFLLDHRT